MNEFNSLLAEALKAAQEAEKVKKPDAMDYCETLWELYNDLQQVGFSETQAFELVVAIAS